MGGLFGIGVYQPVGNSLGLVTPPTGPVSVPTPPVNPPIAIVPTGPGKFHPILVGRPGIPGVTTFFYGAMVAANSCVAYYALDDIGSLAFDSSGHGQSGQISSSGVTEGQPPALLCTGDGSLSSMSFNGSSGSITLPDSLDPTTFPAISVICWVNPKAGGSGTNQRLVANSHTDIDKHGIQMCLQGNTQLQFSAGTGSAVGTVTSSATVPQGSWTMLGATWNPATGVLAVYVNGIQQATGNFSGTLSASSYPIMLARDPAYSNTDWYCGGMAHVSFHNAELSPEVMSNLYLMGINQGAILQNNGWQTSPTEILPPFSGIYGGTYGYVLDTTIRAPKYVQYLPAQSIGNDELGNPVVRSYPQMTWQYTTLRPDYWYYLKNLYKLSGNAPPGYQYLVLLQYPDQSGNNVPVQTLARWNPPTQGNRQVGAYYNVQLTFTYLGQAQLSPGVQIVMLA